MASSEVQVPSGFAKTCAVSDRCERSSTRWPAALAATNAATESSCSLESGSALGAASGVATAVAANAPTGTRPKPIATTTTQTNGRKETDLRTRCSIKTSESAHTKRFLEETSQDLSHY